MKTTGFIFVQKRILLGCLLLIMSGIGFAQNNEFGKGLMKNWSLSLNTGPTIYWGYFSDGKSIKTAFQHGISTGYGIVLTKQISPILGIRGQLLFGSLKAHKDFYGDGAPADLDFSSDLAEGNISAKISLTDLIRGYNPKRFINVYGLAGIGLSSFNGRVVGSVSGNTLYRIGNGSGKGIGGWEIDGMATLGSGLNVRLSKDLDFTVETSMKFLKTDKLGRVKGLFSYDMYSYSSIGITYKIGVPKESKQTNTTPVQNKTTGVKKDIASANVPNKAINKPIEAKMDFAPAPIPVKIENKPVEEKKEVVAIPVPAKVENKMATEETVKKAEIKKEEVKTVEKVVPAEGNLHFSGYKVQIIATLSSVTIESIKQAYNIDEPIREDHFEKWYCFSVGEFQTFHEAKVYTKKLIRINKAKDAFVVKFEDGIRLGYVNK